MGEGESSTPPFDGEGYLPIGLHRASAAAITFRFGAASAKRRRLALRLRRWIELAREVGASRLLIDGSFVTAKADPKDIDAVIWLPASYSCQVEQGIEPALELEEMLLTRRPEEIFAAEDETDWNDWVEFFSCTREPSGREKGLVEVEL